MPTPPSHRPPDDTEEVYFDGSPSLKGHAGLLAGCLLLDLLLAATAVTALLKLDPPAQYIVPPVALLLGTLAVAAVVLAPRLTRYKITSYRIDFERGLLSKSIDTLELWHAEDISFRQTLLDRLLGVGTLTVHSHDDSTPKLVMKGLPNPRQLFDTLKSRIIAVKRQRGVLKLDT